MGVLDDILNDVGAETGRMAKLGAAELAAALFGNGAFVQYGDGQRTPQREKEQEVQSPEPQQPEIDEPEQNQGIEL